MKSQQLVESTLLNQNSVEETENGIAGHQQMDYDVATNSSALDNREDETYFHSYEDLEVREEHPLHEPSVSRQSRSLIHGN